MWGRESMDDITLSKSGAKVLIIEPRTLNSPNNIRGFNNNSPDKAKSAIAGPTYANEAFFFCIFNSQL